MARARIKRALSVESSNRTVNSTSYIDEGFPLYGASGYLGDINEYDQIDKYISIVKDGAGVGRVNRNPEKSSIVATMNYLLPKRGFDLNFLYWVLSVFNFDLYINGSTIPHIYFKDYSNEYFDFPTNKHQQSIANFLDKKIDKINELIQVQEDAIVKFEEYKQQVISETINFGLEKDNLVDSKYEWIKKIPAHWEIEKVARTTYLKGRIGWQGLKSTEFKTEGPHLVTGTDFNNGYVDWDNCVRVTEQRYEEAKFIQVQEGDLLITKDGTIGKVAIAQNAPEKVSVNSGIFVTRPLHNEYINKYFYYLMLSNVFKEFFQLTLTGNSTILHLYQGVFSQFRYPLPPKAEQIEIVNYLDKKTEEIEQLIQIKKDKIEKLNEYKKSLIYEAVTGKIEVM
ncbi:restriction endonuclease subunit S [Hujiaoplasma nucleasis]|uniref:Restriction endonuclease subunit S n=1 Tax=Hujiaoplasma nucleasis TaxID=2725268 RepID=A0A7L6N486_9MOLU|nr:restriction endonuclease subunit S [Hujiaoplasma nucleasis]QLY39389.1 restriction endonuclease subunit S [Hujiaoplasma nucleasis]